MTAAEAARFGRWLRALRHWIRVGDPDKAYNAAREVYRAVAKNMIHLPDPVTTGGSAEGEFVRMLTFMQAEQNRLRLHDEQPRAGDGVVWIWDHAETLSPEVAKLLRDHPWPYGWSVIVDAKVEP